MRCTGEHRWRKFYRWVGVATTAFNWVTLAVVHALLEGTQVDGEEGQQSVCTMDRMCNFDAASRNGGVFLFSPTRVSFGRSTCDGKHHFSVL